jgi:hypothetical protein
MTNNMISGKIYMISSPSTDGVYIGSTQKTLKERLAQHRTNYKCHLNGKYQYVTSFEIIKYDDNMIVLLEDVVCNTIDDLRKRERYYIELYKCVNKVIPIREHKEAQEHYYKNNKDQLKEKKREYCEKNKDKIKQYRENNKDNMKQYYEQNKDYLKNYGNQYYANKKDKIKDYRKEYYEKKKDQIKEDNKLKITCDVCNATFRKNNYARHCKTIKHLKI